MATILQNRLLFAALIGWLCAQVSKTVIHLVSTKTIDLRKLFSSGGMPSSHASTVVALCGSAGIVYGLASTPFAISVTLALVVMYDACGVRREAGRHARKLNALDDQLNHTDQKPQDPLKEFIGHTPSQVFAGAVLGLLVAILFV